MINNEGYFEKLENLHKFEAHAKFCHRYIYDIPRIKF